MERKRGTHHIGVAVLQRLPTDGVGVNPRPQTRSQCELLDELGLDRECEGV